MAPLSYAVAARVLGGFNDAFPQLGLPIQFRLAAINGYPYATVVPTTAPPEAVQRTLGVVNRFAPGLVKMLTGRMSAQMRKQQLDKLYPLFARFDAYWDEDLLPDIERHLAFFESSDLRGLSQAQLNAHFEGGLNRAQKIGALHARAALPAMTAMSMFEELYRELLPDRHPLDALRLLQGFDNRTLAGDRALWRLSRVALTMPPVQRALTENPAGDVIPTLQHGANGGRFLAELDAFLHRYGQRLDDFGQLTEPSWIEEPEKVITCLQAYVTQPEAGPGTERARLAAEREQAIAEARAHLAGYPQVVVDEFETLLRAAQAGVTIKEDNHWVIERLFYQVRRLALEFGRRLVESGALASAGDVFYLTAAELLAGSAGTASLPAPERLQQRKAKREHFMGIAPPPLLGTAPAFVPEDESPFGRAFTKADGATAPGGSGDAQALYGQPASAGVIRGKARIVRTLAEAGKLQPGDVLVAKSTMPPWTPLFGIAAAVVTDTGGILSHCAVVAREYRIPAVVGTGRATEIFQDGQFLEVNGDAGLVRMIDTREA
jgi:pyruvate,water dikinase